LKYFEDGAMDESAQNGILIMMIYKHHKSGICFVCMLFCGVYCGVFVMEEKRERGRIESGVKIEDLEELKALHANLVDALEIKFRALKISEGNQ
jgi:hypothetical protein